MNRKAELIQTFGNRIRTRVCGVCIQDEKILLIKHANIGKKGFLWAPPGGGLGFGENVKDCLIREFNEEAGLTIEVEEFMFVYEYLNPPLHSVELFFKVKIVDGVLIKGTDPELSSGNQMIEEVKFCDNAFINSMSPDYFHGSIGIAKTIEKLIQLKGYYFSD